MHALEFLRSTSKLEPKPIYAAFGDDVYLKSEVLDSIVKLSLGGSADDMAVTRFPGESTGLAKVLDEVRTLPFLAKCRVAIVENADPFVTAHRKELEAFAQRPGSTGVLVLVVKLWPSSTNLAKLVEKIGMSVDCKAPSERELPKWLVNFAKDQFEIKLDDNAAKLMVELVGAEVGLLASEVEKLWVYVGDRKSIGTDDVMKMVGAGKIETVWKALDAATTGRAAEAFEDIDKLIASGQHPVGILAAWAASLKKVHHAGQLRRAKYDLGEACKIAGVLPFAIKTTGMQHAHLGPSRVDGLPKLLLQADLDLKGSSQLSARAVMDRLVIELAKPRRD